MNLCRNHRDAFVIYTTNKCPFCELEDSLGKEEEVETKDDVPAYDPNFSGFIGSKPL